MCWVCWLFKNSTATHFVIRFSRIPIILASIAFSSFGFLKGHFLSYISSLYVFLYNLDPSFFGSMHHPSITIIYNPITPSNGCTLTCVHIIEKGFPPFYRKLMPQLISHDHGHFLSCIFLYSSSSISASSFSHTHPY